MAKIIKTKRFVSLVTRETSFRADVIGEGQSEMTLTVEGDRGCIEWDIPNLGEFAEIGLIFEGRELHDYDGVFSLPAEAIELIEEAGFTVGEEFR